MLQSRRHHKKSRNGCFECKKRHIKCDENHPICSNCGTAEIRCSFLSRDEPYIVQTVQADTSYISTNSSPRAKESASSASSISDLNVYLKPTVEIDPENHSNDIDSVGLYSVNMVHLKLFSHLSDEAFRLPDRLTGEYEGTVPGDLYLQYASSTPFLMHQLLASSALHLSITSSDSRTREFYQRYATGLQNRALSLFHENYPVLEVASTNFAVLFLFATSVAAHLFCETLHYHRSTLDVFIDKFAHDINVYRGVIAVVDNLGHLRESEVTADIKMSQLLVDLPDPIGPDCNALRDMICGLDITSPQFKAYEKSIDLLQRCFDLHKTSGDKILIAAVLTWAILIPQDYVDSLRQQQPEALVILAHYAVILHRARAFWLIEESSGRFIVESICRRLSSDWQKFIQFPNEALR
ncbi:hypothetical protein TWF694_009051 [Orbilia ellipsospora]|uniref:Zn(2)-C6 fungal-type domain-containing protein n=1 Tax=Orbilia ellipsospora TaxID=2528407 RepID=A0AAV9XEY5_9PEZI